MTKSLKTLKTLKTLMIAFFTLIGFVIGFTPFFIIILLTSCTPPQSSYTPPGAPPSPQPAPCVVQMVSSALKGSGEGRDVAILRYFLAHKEQLSPIDIDYMAKNTWDNEIKGFIVAEYYAKPTEVEHK